MLTLFSSSIKLPVPGNITLMPLPSKSPELNPVEIIWHFMRNNNTSSNITTTFATTGEDEQ